jgi:hypothetical protein
VPTTAEIPSIESHHLQTLTGASVTGAKGVGEGGTINQRVFTPSGDGQSREQPSSSKCLRTSSFCQVAGFWPFTRRHRASVLLSTRKNVCGGGGQTSSLSKEASNDQKM